MGVFVPVSSTHASNRCLQLVWPYLIEVLACNRPFAQLLPGLETGHPVTVGQSLAYDFSVKASRKLFFLSPFRTVLSAIHVQVTDRPSPDAPSLTQAIIVQMVYWSGHIWWRFCTRLMPGVDKVNVNIFFNVSLGSCWTIVWILFSPSAPADEFLALTFQPGLPFLFQGTFCLKKTRAILVENVWAENLPAGAEGEIRFQFFLPW